MPQPAPQPAQQPSPRLFTERFISDPRFCLSVRLLACYANHGAITQAQYLPTTQLAAQFARNASTIRRALHMLAEAGYLIAYPVALPRGGRGTAYRIRI